MAIPDFLEDTVKDYSKQATAAYSAPINTDTFTGRQFVAGQDPMQTQAAALATQGVGSYSPYLQAAQTAQTAGAGALGNAATAIGGLGAIQNQAGNIAQGADEKGGKVGSAKDMSTGNVNVPGGKASKSMKAQPKGHGAEKKGQGETADNKKSLTSK